MKSIGYARSASTTGSLESQVEALRAAGCDMIFSETVSGVAEELPELNKAIATLAEGDELVIVDLVRIGRDMASSIDRLLAIQARGATLRSLAEALSADTESLDPRKAAIEL